MTGTRRTGNGIRWRHARTAQGYVPGAVDREPVHADTQVIVMPAPLAQDFAGGLAHADLLEIAEALAGPYESMPVPDIGSRYPADRQAWFDARPGDSEPVFRSTVADLEAMWLLDTTLPAPVRKTAPAEGTEPLSGASPAGESATAPAGMDAPPVAPDRVITDSAEPAQDEPAEPDCADGGES